MSKMQEYVRNVVRYKPPAPVSPNHMSNTNRLLVDRAVGMLKAQKYLPSNEIFVVVAAAFAGITTAPWVELTRDEFLDMFGPDTVLQ